MNRSRQLTFASLCSSYICLNLKASKSRIQISPDVLICFYPYKVFVICQILKVFKAYDYSF